MRVTIKFLVCLLIDEACFNSLFRLRRFALLAFLISAFSSIGVLQSAVIVRPEQAIYYVLPGETFDIRIHIDANDSTLGSNFELLPDGLFSYGVQASFPSSLATVASVGQVNPVATLNFFGSSLGAMKQVTSNNASVKGNIDPVSGTPHSSSLLLTIQLTNLAPAPSSYVVQLDEWRTLGASEQIFITGSGAVLDTSPSSGLFLPALIVVVPEPSAFYLLMYSAMIIAGMRQQKGAFGVYHSET